MKRSILICLALLITVFSCKRNAADIMSISKGFDSIITVAESLSDSGYVDQGLALVQQEYKQLNNPGLGDQFAYFDFCSIYYNRHGNSARALEVGDSMLAALEGYDASPTILAHRSGAYNIKADAEFAQGLYKDAYDNYYRALKLARDNNNDSCSLRSYSYSLAMTLYRQKRFRESARNFLDAYTYTRPCSEDFNIFYFKQELLDNIGLCYNALGDYDSALYYYAKALHYLEENNGRYGHKHANVYEAPKAVVYGNMAEVYKHLGKHDSAKILYEHSISINLGKGYANDDALTDHVKLARLHYETGNLPAMKRALDSIRAELDTIPDQKARIGWHRLMWRYLERTGDSLAAFRHLRLYTSENEAYLASNKTLMEADMDTRVRDLEKQYRIDLLTKDKRQKNGYLLVLALVAVMAFIIAFMVLREVRRTRRHVAALKELNSTVKRQKEQLEGALLQVKEKEADKSRILKTVAHDVMNPMAAVVSLTDILTHDAERLSQEQIDVIGLIREAGTNSLNLSRDILEASEEIDHKATEKEHTDINLLVARSVELLNFRALAKKQRIVTHYPAQHVFAWVYKDKMRRVFHNILANAIKFSYEDADIVVTLEVKEGNVHLAVKDHGIGIPEKNKQHVFEMFTDAKMPGTSGETPHGLGLSISLQIARAHGGDIWFESEEGKGTTFHIVFPAGEQQTTI